MLKKEACARILQPATKLTNQSLDLGSSSPIVTKITTATLHPTLQTSSKTARKVAKMKNICLVTTFVLLKKVEITNKRNSINTLLL